MKIIMHIIYCLILTVLMVSCSMNNDVVNRGVFQKRKYNKGIHFSIKKNIKETKTTEKQDLETVCLLVKNEEKHVCQEDFQIEKENVKCNSIAENTVLSEERGAEVNFDDKKNRGRTISKLSFFNKRNVAIASLKRNRIDMIRTVPKSNGGGVFVMVLGLIIAMFLPPVGVGIALGFGSGPAKTNLWLFLIGVLLIAVGALLLAYTLSEVFVLLYTLGGIMLFASWMHGLVVIVNEF